MHCRRVPFLILLAASTLAAPPRAQQPLPADRADGAAAVTVADTKAWMATLTSPEFGGRGTGQDGFQKAADFVRDRFAELGLEPAGDDGSWFQSLGWRRTQPDLAACRVVFTREGRELVIPGARLEGSIGKALTAEGGVVLVPIAAADDLDDLDLAGKVVVGVLPAPTAAADGERPRRGARGGPAANLLRALQGKNAAAVVLAQPAAIGTPLTGQSLPGGGNRAARGARLQPTVVTLGGEDCTALLALAAIAADQPLTAPQAVPLTAKVEIVVGDEPAPACNVVGILRGGDPQKNSEYVVVGSHLDHLGRAGSRYFPGADDDGSGTTGVLAVATMLAKNKVRPARSVLFVCFCGEEMGLLGSAHFVKNSPIPLSSITAELQMDMIGRDEEEAYDGPRLVNKGEQAADNRNSVHLVGTQKLSPMLHELCMQKNAAAGLSVEWDQESLFDRSDHANFGRMGVPIAFFFTGLHMDYHQTSDTPDKIHYEKLLRVATWVYDIAFELAQQPGRPLVEPSLWAKYRDKGSREPAAPTAAGATGGDPPKVR